MLRAKRYLNYAKLAQEWSFRFDDIRYTDVNLHHYSLQNKYITDIINL